MAKIDDTREVKFDFMSIRAGDIIFVLPESSGLRKLTQLTNIHGQHFLAKIRRSNRLALKASVRKYSHVMLGAGDGLIIHADGKKVALEVVIDALNFESTRYQVFRHADLSAEAALQVAKAGMRYLQQKYSFMTYFGKGRKGDTTQFCSRLVAHAYRAAGLPLSALPDKDVLPLDLYLLCQESPWRDITAETLVPPLSPDNGNIFGNIEIPGRESLSLSEFLESSDKLLLNNLQFQKKFQEMVLGHHRSILRMEALLAQFCLATFTLTKHFRADPGAIDDAFAGRITRVMSQMDTLLDLALLPDINLLIEKTLINTDAGETGESAYAGMPTPTAIREMQTSRETIMIYTYLLMAEIGLLSILAHKISHEKLETFRVVKSGYATGFMAALPQIDTLSAYEEVEDPFAWVDKEPDREFCQKLYKNMIELLKIIRIDTVSSMA